MQALHRLRALCRNLMRAKDVDREDEQELRAFAEMLAEEKIRAGVPADAARREARLALGGMQQVMEEVRQARTGAWLEELTRDVRYALRGLRRSPAFALTAIVTLALGIGANTAMFSVIDALLFKPLPVAEPERLVAAYRGADGTAQAFSYPEFAAMAGRSGVFSAAAAWGTQLAWLRDGTGTDRVGVHTVSPDYFGALGVSPSRGMPFSTVTEGASAATVVISDRLWRSRFNADPAIIGRSFNLDGHAVSIVGVAPAGFTGLDPSAPADVWMTFATLALLEPGWDFRAPTEIWLHVIARLQDGISARAAESAMPPLTGLAPGAGATRVRFVPAATPIFDPAARAASAKLAALAGGVSLFVLLIACANVANLLLVRGTARGREVGVRLAIGASRARVARQMMVESGVLALAGCAAGLLLARLTLQAVVAIAPRAAIPPGIIVAIDGRVVLFAVLASVVVTMLFGLAPAWHASRVDVLSQVKGGLADAGAPRAPLYFRRGLAVAQVALSTVLLIGAALFVRTLLATLAISPGYDVDRVLLTTLDFTAAKLAPADARRAADLVLSRVRALPGVEGAALGQIVPFSGAFVMRPAVPAGVPIRDAADTERFTVPYGVVSEGYFATLGMPLRGRDFSPADTDAAPAVTIVNETLARKYWPGQNAVGQRLTLPIRGAGPEVEVIGVVPDGKYVELTEAQHPYFYLPWKQVHRPRVTLHVRTAGQPAAFAGAVRAVVREVSQDIPAINPTTLAANVERSTAQQRVVSRLLVVFAGIAVLVAAVGIYGLTAYTVARRTKELGIRMALGARPADVVRLLVSQTSLLVGAGLLIGIAGAAALARVVASWLYGVSPLDPIAFGVTSAGVIVTMLVATLVPARRATRVDPLAALRYD